MKNPTNMLHVMHMMFFAHILYFVFGLGATTYHFPKPFKRDKKRSPPPPLGPSNTCKAAIAFESCGSNWDTSSEKSDDPIDDPRFSKDDDICGI